MNKQLLSFASLVALAVTHPSLSGVAAPPDSAASTAESDRQFLNNLEDKNAAKAAPVPSAPAPVASASQQPQVMPIPVQPAALAPAAPAPAASAPQRRSQSTENQTVINGKWSAQDTSDAPNPRPARSVSRATSIAPRKEVQTRPATTVPTRREVATVQSQTSDVRTNDGQGVSVKTSKSRAVDGSVPMESKISVRRSRDVAPDEEGTHIVQPAEIAQYGVAPTVPTKTTRVTTTYVQQPVAVPQQADGNEGRDEDRNQEKRFFHRLFNGGLFKKHVDDHD
ncbi:MAG TPA: hypothetical protein VK961_16885 [Chthoniobacter sp.]|nr:hypothetical protein [Chthoniobacter sp.]